MRKIVRAAHPTTIHSKMVRVPRFNVGCAVRTILLLRLIALD
jgi:hypothetical protein